jgi:MEDS: MEthanogen/methylotroph, DcmR Sensory domain
LVPYSVEDALREMPGGTHAVLVYDTRENKRGILFDYLKKGAGTDGLVYICSEESKFEIREEMKASGMDVRGFEAKGELAIRDYDEVYVAGGEVNPPNIISGLSKLSWGYNHRGMNGIRAASEMSRFFKEGRVRELLEYEKALHRKFTFPGTGVCAYNIVEMGASGSLDALWPILRAHSLVIMTGPHGSFALEPEQVTSVQVESTMGVKPPPNTVDLPTVLS